MQIDGEIIPKDIPEELETPPVVASESPRQVQVFNPLDAEQVTFAAMLERRRDNYDQLGMHLRAVLVPGMDFDRLHVSKNCDVWRCRNPNHLSDWTLLASGADRILGLLGLAVHYPGMQAYKDAALAGVKLVDIIIDCHILSHTDQVISEGAGACSRDKMKGDLNNTIKRACKRARLDAVKRLPVVSALFETDFLDQVARAASENGNNSTTKRAQTVKSGKKWDTGAKLDVCPIGKEIKGKKWRDIETEALQYLVDHVDDKPDITRAAAEELAKRVTPSDPAESGSIHTEPPPASPPYADEPERCAVHGCEMDGEHCPECERLEEQERA